MQLRRAGNGNNPWLLREQPCQRDLSRGRTLLFCNTAKQINQSLIRLSSLRPKTGKDVAIIRAIELRLSLILPVRKPLPRGLKGTNPIPSDHLFFVVGGAVAESHSQAT